MLDLPRVSSRKKLLRLYAREAAAHAVAKRQNARILSSSIETTKLDTGNSTDRQNDKIDRMKTAVMLAGVSTAWSHISP